MGRQLRLNPWGLSVEASQIFVEIPRRAYEIFEARRLPTSMRFLLFLELGLFGTLGLEFVDLLCLRIAASARMSA